MYLSVCLVSYPTDNNEACLKDILNSTDVDLYYDIYNSNHENNKNNNNSDDISGDDGDNGDS